MALRKSGEKMKISVLIPVYNNESYLRECLDSVAKQSLCEIEIICINDGSTDASLSIMHEFADKDKRFIIIDKKNSGYGDSLNKGMEVARGEYVAVVESDDFIEDNMMEVLYNTAIKFDADIVKSNFYEYTQENGSTFKELMNNALYDEVFSPWQYSKVFTGEMFLWTSIYKKRFLDENGIRFNNTPGASYQDVSFIFKAYSCTERAVSVRDAFYHYRKDNPNSSVKSKEKVYCICDEFDEIKDFLENRPHIRKRTLGFLPYMLFVRYRATYHRIDEVFRAEFLARLAADLAIYDEKEINRAIWAEDNWEWYLHIKEQCVNDFFSYNMHEWFRDAVRAMLEKNVYIYGAGMVAQRVRTWMEDNGIHITAYLITKLDGEYDCDIPVMVFKEVKASLPRDCCILLSVGEKFQGEVLIYLLQNGIKSVVPMNQMVRRMLRIR
ncbi:MAG: glycosyltransferase [Schwartzia succinivorans]|nr:glycosyltransferase [Schwartzia succinivorans]